MPDFHGVYRGSVHDVNDPQMRGRIRALVPGVLGDAPSAWAEPVLPAPSRTRWKVGDKIWVQFEHGDINKPVFQSKVKIIVNEIEAGELEADVAIVGQLSIGDTIFLNPEDGILAVDGDGNPTFHVDPITGDVTIEGVFSTSAEGERITLNFDKILLYSGLSGETPGYIDPVARSTGGVISLRPSMEIAPAATSFYDETPKLTMSSDNTPEGRLFQFDTGYFRVNGTNTLNLTTDSSDITAGGGAGTIITDDTLVSIGAVALVSINSPGLVQIVGGGVSFTTPSGETFSFNGGLINGEMGDGSIGVGTFRDSVDARVSAGVTGKADLASPTFTGTPAAPTAAPGTNTTQVATTAFVAAADALKANIASPTLTGTPTAPTAAPGTNTTQVATTAFVAAADALKANIASPTLTGTPTAPTAAPGTNTTQVATTAFVAAADALKANLASPSFSGTVNIATVGTGSVGTGTFADSIWAMGESSQAETSADITNTGSSNTTATDLSTTFTSPGTSAVYMIDLDADMQITTGGATCVAEVLVAGVAQTRAVLFTGQANGDRANVHRKYRVTGLAAGSVTITVRTRSITAATTTIFRVGSTLTVQRVK